jgi:predicted outer membrane protein
MSTRIAIDTSATFRVPRPLLWVTCSLLLCVLGVARAESQATVESAEFARNVAQHFSTQLTAARAVQKRTHDAAVNDFATRLAAEYEQAAQALTSICEQLKIDVPAPAVEGRLAGAVPAGPDASVDRVFTLETSQELAKADALFEQALRSSTLDPKLKEFARRQRQVVQTYRRQAEPLARGQAGQVSR